MQNAIFNQKEYQLRKNSMIWKLCKLIA